MKIPAALIKHLCVNLLQRSFLPAVLAFIGLALAGCPMDTKCLDPDPKYSFEVPGAFTPEPDSVQVGDTIFFISEFPSSLTPVGGNAPVDYSNAKSIGFLLNIVELPDNTTVPSNAGHQFDITPVNGNLEAIESNSSRAGAFRSVEYIETQGVYKLKLVIIPKKTGLFKLGVTSGYSDGRTTNGKFHCDRAGFTIKLTNVNTNDDLFEKWLGEQAVGKPVNSYTFIVY